MKRRIAIKGLLGGSLLLGRASAQGVRQRVASLGQFARVWDHVEFGYQGKPATLIRVPRPERADQKLLRAGPDFYLSGYLRECPHNGCEVKFHPSADHLLICFCHSSLFLRADGRHQSGVANEDLPALRLGLEGEEVLVLGLSSP